MHKMEGEDFMFLLIRNGVICVTIIVTIVFSILEGYFDQNSRFMQEYFVARMYSKTEDERNEYDHKYKEASKKEALGVLLFWLFAVCIWANMGIGAYYLLTHLTNI